MKKFAVLLILAVPAVYLALPKAEATIYYQAGCGCCEEYAEYLSSDFTVSKVQGNVKDRFGIPEEVRSCHTVVMGDYFIEGHVPKEAIKKLLEERPDIDGIAVPGMPEGSPGMPGEKSELTVLWVKGESTGVFMRW